MPAACATIKIIVPDGIDALAGYPAAVVAGNVEVSQAVTDCLFGAVGACKLLHKAR
jgi:5-oxoprolinase (ATP-hydrolysing)